MNEGQIFWLNLENIRATLRMDEDQFSSFMGMDLNDFLKKKFKRELLPFNVILSIGVRLHIDYNDLFLQNFNINQILHRQSSGKILNDKYTVGTYTRPIVILNTIEYIHRFLGVRAKSEILDGFNLDLDFLKRDDVRLNIHLNKDILAFLRAKHELGLDFFTNMGRTVAENLKGSSMAQKIASQKNIGQMLEHFIQECTPQFDQNFHYSLKSLNKDFSLIEARPRKNVLEELKISPLYFGSDPADYNRMGIFSSISYFHFGKFAEVKRISDILTGDKSSCYLIDLRPFRYKKSSSIE